MIPKLDDLGSKGRMTMIGNSVKNVIFDLERRPNIRKQRSFDSLSTTPDISLFIIQRVIGTPVISRTTG